MNCENTISLLSIVDSPKISLLRNLCFLPVPPEKQKIPWAGMSHFALESDYVFVFVWCKEEKRTLSTFCPTMSERKNHE